MYSKYEQTKQMEFPGVVGSDIERAKLSIRTKLGHTQVHFIVQPWRQQRGGTRAVLTKDSNTIVLWYDQRYNAIALSPKFYGRVHTYYEEY